MNPALVATVVSIFLIIAILVGRQLRRMLPGRQLDDDTKDTVKLAMGLVGTMSALLLGLLVSSARASYDAERNQVVQMAAKVSFLDRVLALYGPEATAARAEFRLTVEDSIQRIWPKEEKMPSQLHPNISVADSAYLAIEALVPSTDAQQKIKTIAETTMTEIAQQRALLVAQSQSSISTPMLVVVVSWLIVIFASFSLLAPPNLTASLALLVSTLAVSGAIFLLLELDSPFDGLIRIPSQELANALNPLPK